MPLIVPSVKGKMNSRNYSGRPVAALGTSVTAGTPAHSEGTIVELFSATTHPTTLLRLGFSGLGTSASGKFGLFNLYVGSSFGHKLIPNLLVAMAGSITSQGRRAILVEFPIYIPAGTRIGGSLQSNLTTNSVDVTVDLFDTGEWAGTRVECLGADTSTSLGTLVTPGTTSEGSLTSIGTTTFDYKSIIPMLGPNSTSVLDSETTAIDIGTSGAVITGLTDIVYSTSTSETTGSPFINRPLHTHISSGTGLYVRLQNLFTSTQQRSICLYGIG